MLNKVLRWMQELKFVDFISRSSRWSGIKKFTVSRASQLTVLAPFVGYLIIFNSEINNFLIIVLPENSAIEGNNWLKHNSLTFTYFGLLAYGVGVALFSIFCPQQIKDSSSITDYVTSMEEVKTPNLVRRHIAEVLRRFFIHNVGEAATGFNSLASPSFPNDAARPLHFLAEHLAEIGLDDAEIIQALQTGSGYWETDRILELMESTTRVDRVYQRQLLDAAQLVSKEVFYVSYRVFDYKGFFQRISAMAFFIIGLGLLLVPTLVTCWAIVGRN